MGFLLRVWDFSAGARTSTVAISAAWMGILAMTASRSLFEIWVSMALILLGLALFGLCWSVAPSRAVTSLPPAADKVELLMVSGGWGEDRPDGSTGGHGYGCVDDETLTHIEFVGAG